MSDSHTGISMIGMRTCTDKFWTFDNEEILREMNESNYFKANDAIPTEEKRQQRRKHNFCLIQRHAIEGGYDVSCIC